MKKNKLLFSCMLVCMGLSSCGGNSEQTQTNPPTTNTTSNNQTSPTNSHPVDTQTSTKNLYYVGSELSKFPVVVHDGKGNVTGFEADLLKAVAEKQGFKVEYNIDKWSGLLKKLDTDNTDMLIGSITITNERSAQMDFSNPVLAYKTGVMVRPKLAHIKQFSELQGQKVNLRRNTVYEQLIPIFSNENGSNMVYSDSVWGQMKSLLEGESDAMVAASITLEYYKNQYPNEKFHIIYEDNAPIAHYGWAVKKGNTELLNRLNIGLNKVKQDGTYDKIYQKYWPNSTAGK